MSAQWATRSVPPAAGPEVMAVPRALVAALLDEVSCRVALGAHGGVVAVAATGAALAGIRAGARVAVEEFLRELASSAGGRSLASAALAEIGESDEVWLMLFARPTAGADRARLVTVATAAATLRTSARWFGLAARSWPGAGLASGAICDIVARASGPWFAGAELVSAVALTPGGVSATIPPAAPERDEAVPLVWLDGSSSRAAVCPSAEPASPTHSMMPSVPIPTLLCEPGEIADGLDRTLVDAGCSVRRVSAAELLEACGGDRVELVVASLDTAANRNALASLSRIAPDLPLIATTRVGHDDLGTTAEGLGARALLHLPVAPRELAQCARGLAETRRRMDELRRHADALTAAQSDLIRSERMATLGWLAASVGHDLRTPLAAVRSNSELALRALERIEKELGTASPSLLRTVKTLADLERTNLEAVGRLNEIVAALKSFGRVEPDGPRRSALGAVVAQVLSLCVGEVRHARVVVSIPDGLPEVAAGHAELMQVVMNLIVNAAHAVDPGGTIEIRAAVAGPGSLTLSVADDGPGVAARVRAQLFKAGVTTKATRGGTGLGLSIAKRVVEGCGGTIELVDQQGPGATFRLVLPQAVS